MSSRLIPTPGDVAECWRNTARLQDALGLLDAAKNSRVVAKRVSSANAWVREHGARR